MSQQIVSKAVGIDLGTTNSAVAVMNPSDSEIVIHRDPISKSYTTPSCVWRSPAGGELVVGRKAFARKGSNPEPVTSVKRLMGSRTTVDLAGEEYTPPQVSAAILAEMKRRIETDVAAFDSPDVRWIVDRAVVTVPAYFDQPQIDATRKAAEQAGLEVLGLLHEPTAAASHYCWRTATRDGTFLVYDLGGGTFDVSVLRCTAGTFEVLGISGNNRLGGDDIDEAFARHLQKMLQADGYALDLDPENDPEDRLRFSQLKILAEGAKKALTDQPDYMLRDTGRLTDQEKRPVVIDALLERPELDDIARPLIERTFTYCDEALRRAEDRAGITLADVDHIILAGGSTHMPLVREMVTQELCANPAPGSARQVRAACETPVVEHADTAVALGAAVRAAAVGGLAVYDEDRTVRVSFRGSATTGSAATHIGGSVEALTDGLDFSGGYVRLTTTAFEDQADLSEEGAFSFTQVPVQPDAESLLTFEVYDAEGDLVATAGRAVAHSSGELPPDGGTGGAALNSKAIHLEVDRGDGRTGRRVLIPAMEQLPYAADYDFGHPGTEDVELRLFQQGVPIQVIKVRVPSSTPRGTAIRLNVAMQENVSMTVQGSIGEDTTFDALLEVPVDPPLPEAPAVDELYRRFEENVGYLAAGPQAVVRAKWTKARRAFEEARDRGDVPAAVHEFRELEEIVAVLGEAGQELQPPKRDFDALVEDCLRLHAHLAESGPAGDKPFDGPEVIRAIEAQRAEGERAHAAGDQRRYGEAIAQLQGHFTYLRSLLRSSPGGEISAQDRAEGLLRFGFQQVEELSRVALARGRTSEERDLAAVKSRLEQLVPLLATNPDQVVQDAGKLAARLRQLAQILLGAQSEGPGLPEDRTGNWTPSGGNL
ncbi:Hsp70 family protein [Streptomyces sp. NPDC048527]|uniref:Hsp70 family protein n=1 Tax=Streptomyces sp. NPDC048527 TaxID=3365568 RepID=UPI00371A9607